MKNKSLPASHKHRSPPHPPRVLIREFPLLPLPPQQSSTASTPFRPPIMEPFPVQTLKDHRNRMRPSLLPRACTRTRTRTASAAVGRLGYLLLRQNAPYEPGPLRAGQDAMDARDLAYVCADAQGEGEGQGGHWWDGGIIGRWPD